MLEIIAFTDPVCTWCWGSEPVLRKLALHYEGQLQFSYVMGGLVKDIRGFYDSANGIGGDPEQSNKQIARHWVEASARHGMPVRIDGFKLFTSETVSTYPQNIAFKAVELASPTLASRFLRRVREASAAEARETGRREVLVELASEVGVDIEAFLNHLEDGSAEAAFREDLELTRRYSVRGFPTFLLRYNGRELMLRSYQGYGAWVSAINTLTERALVANTVAKDSATLLKFLASGRSAPAEIASAFDLPPQDLTDLLSGMLSDGQIRFVSAGNGGFWEIAASGQHCDPESGVCTT